MDDASVLSQISPFLGAFTPVALLGWWIINRLSKQIEALQAQHAAERKELIDRNNALTDRFFTLGQTMATVLAELKAGLKGID
jgi:hypothetical protein